MAYLTREITGHEAWDGDCLNRVEFSESIKDIIDFKHNIIHENGYCIALDSGFGNGKSYFVTNFSQIINDKSEFTSIYYSAWDDDYSDHPYIPFTSSLIASLKEAKIVPEKSRLEDSANTLGLDIGVSLLDIGSMAETGIALGSIAKKAINKLKTPISGYQETKNHIKAFKETLAEKSKDKMIVIFVDELERCKPTYALELLEVIKHIFNVPNVLFIISTSLEQMEHTVRQVYGQGIDASGYLSRFFDQKIKLPNVDRKDFIKNYSTQVERQLLEPYAYISSGLNVSYRDLKKVLDMEKRLAGEHPEKLAFFLMICIYICGYKKLDSLNGVSNVNEWLQWIDTIVSNDLTDQEATAISRSIAYMCRGVGDLTYKQRYYVKDIDNGEVMETEHTARAVLKNTNLGEKLPRLCYWLQQDYSNVFAILHEKNMIEHTNWLKKFKDILEQG